MWELLKRLSAECWGRHDWIYRANARGLWLECRRCGQESPGLELAAPRYHQTQTGIDDAHRIGVAPVLRAVVTADADASGPRRFERRGAARRVVASDRPDVVEPATLVGERLTDAERRWLQAWRTLASDERVLAERMVDSLSLTRSATHRFAGRERPVLAESTAAETHGRMAG